MIFGFNTDIKQGDTVYHVQSEARESELLLQTQVFVRGRCIGKRATPYGEKAGRRFYRPAKRAGLRDQHRLVLDAIRDGRLDDVLDKRETPETLAAIKELDLHWMNANSVHSDRNLTMRLRVTESGSAVSGARLTVRFARPDATPFYAQVVTDQAGDAEMKIEVDESSAAGLVGAGAGQLLRPHRHPQVPAKKSRGLISGNLHRLRRESCPQLSGRAKLDEHRGRISREGHGFTRAAADIKSCGFRPLRHASWSACTEPRVLARAAISCENRFR